MRGLFFLRRVDRAAAEADAQLKPGHRVSARDNYLRACNYHRSSEFFLHANPDDPRMARAFERSVARYRASAALFAPAIEPLEIAYEGTTLLGYFHTPAGPVRRRPTILVNNGFDDSAEEMHWGAARAAVDRGWNALVFDGPGQFAAVHRARLYFRPDWEKVVTPVVDFALKRPDVDPRRIALHGISFGGYLAPRAAAFEHRIAAGIADDGVYDCGAAQLSGIPEASRAQVKAALSAPSAPQLDARLLQMMKTNSVARWAFTQGMYAMGGRQPARLPGGGAGPSPARWHRRADPMPDAGVRRREGSFLQRPGPAVARAPHVPQDADEVQRRRRRRRPLRGGREPAGVRAHVRLAR